MIALREIRLRKVGLLLLVLGVATLFVFPHVSVNAHTSCGKKLEWQAPELNGGTPETYLCSYEDDDNVTHEFTCHRHAWSIPGHNICKSATPPEQCDCCRTYRYKASWVDVICNETGCQPGSNPWVAEPVPAVYYYSAELFPCEGTPSGQPPSCDDAESHANCGLILNP